jgi:hypothetical protein
MGSPQQCYVIRVHAHLEETVGHVNHSPDFTLGTVVQNVINSWEGVGVSNCILVKLPVVIDPMRQH